MNVDGLVNVEGLASFIPKHPLGLLEAYFSYFFNIYYRLSEVVIFPSDNKLPKGPKDLLGRSPQGFRHS